MSLLKASETLGVGDALGIQARFTQNVCHVVGDIGLQGQSLNGTCTG